MEEAYMSKGRPNAGRRAKIADINKYGRKEATHEASTERAQRRTQLQERRALDRKLNAMSPSELQEAAGLGSVYRDRDAAVNAATSPQTKFSNRRGTNPYNRPEED